MEKPIFMGNFVFCFLQERPILGNDCHGCDYMKTGDNEYFCTFETEEEKSKSESDLYNTAEIITLLVYCLEKGQTTLNRDELKKLLHI